MSEAHCSRGIRESLPCAVCGARLSGGLCILCLLDSSETNSEMGMMPLDDDELSGLWNGRRIHSYAISELLGRGSMGEVFLARQIQTKRVVALKLMHESVPLERILREVSALSQLDHEGIASILDFGEDAGRRFVVMPYISGGTLERAASSKSTTAKEAAQWMAMVGRAVQYAHERGIYHRDLKPQNILLGPDRKPRVTDFGLALVNGQAGLTITGQVLGSPSYMAPEQISGRQENSPVLIDVYGLGATFYFLLTGVPPFRGGNQEEVMFRVVQQEPVAPRRLNSDVDRDLETICLACLEKNPNQRYRTAGEFADDIDRWLTGQPIIKRPVGVFGRCLKLVKRQPALSSAVLAASVAICLAIGGGAWHYREQAQLNRRLQGEISTTTLTLANQSVQQGDVVAAMRILARHVRSTPEQTQTATRLWSLLEHRSWVRPVKRLPAIGMLPAVRWHPNGKLLLTVSQSFVGGASDAILWNAVSGENVATCRMEGGAGGEVDFSPSGEFVITANGSQCRLRDAHSLQALGKPLPQTDRSASFRWLPDGRRVVLSSPSGASLIQVNYPPNPTNAYTVLREFPMSASVACVGTTPDGDWIAAADLKGRVKLWRVADGQEVAGPFEHGHLVVGLALTHERLLVALADQKVLIRSLPDGKEVRISRGHEIGEVSPDGRFLLLFSRLRRDNSAQLIESGSDRIVETWSAATAPFPAFAANGLFGVVPRDGSLEFWDPLRLKKVAEPMYAAGHFLSAALSPDGSHIAFGDLISHVSTWSVPERQPEQFIKLTQGADARVSSPEWTALVRGRAVELEPRTADVRGTKRIMPGGSTVNLFFDACIPGRLACVDDTGVVTVWDCNEGRQVARVETGYRAYVAMGGGTIAALLQDKLFRWDASNGKTLGQPTSLADSIAPLYGMISNASAGVFFSPDGRFILTGTFDGQVQCVDGSDGTVLWSGRHDRPVTCIAFQPGGHLVASGAADNTVRLWDLQSGSPIFRPLQHGGYIRSVCFSPDGFQLLATAIDGRLTSWNTASGKIGLSFQPNDGDEFSACYTSPSTIITASKAGVIRLWDSASGQALSELIHFRSGAVIPFLAHVDNEVWISIPGRVVGKLELPPAGPPPAWFADLADNITGLGVAGRPLETLFEIKADLLKKRTEQGSWDAWGAHWFGVPGQLP